jgi:hypothetical protein
MSKQSWHLAVHERDSMRCLGVFPTAESARSELDRQHPGRFTDWGWTDASECFGYEGDAAEGAWDDPYVVVEDLTFTRTACPSHAVAAVA